MTGRLKLFGGAFFALSVMCSWSLPFFDSQAVGNPFPVCDDNDAAVHGADWLDWPNWPSNIGSRASEEYDGSHLYTLANPGPELNKVEFNLDAPQGGKYSLYAWWTSHENRATNAPYKFIDKFGTPQTITVSQQIHGGQWNYLGSYFFNAGTVTITLSDEYTDGIVVADAVKFEPVQ